MLSRRGRKSGKKCLTLHYSTRFSVLVIEMNGNSDRLTVAGLARRAGVKGSTVRVYVREGLLAAPDRSASNYRLFTADSVARIRFARRAQQLGFTLAEIKGLLALRVNRRNRCSDVRRLAETKIADIEGRIRSLEAMRRALVKLAKECGIEQRSGVCPILEHLESDFE